MAKLRVAPALEPISLMTAEGLDRMVIARFFGVAAAMISVAFGAAHLRDQNAERSEPRMARAEPPAVIASYVKEDAPRVAAAQPQTTAPRPRAEGRVHPADPWWTVLFAGSAMAAEPPRAQRDGTRALGAAPLKITDRWVPRAAPTQARSPHEQRAAFLEARTATPDGARDSERTITLDDAAAADGRTLRAGGVEIELGGVDLPEPAAMCTLLSGKSEPCMKRAQTQLELLVRGQTVSCQVTSAPGARAIGRCTAGKYDLAQWLVKQGWLKPKAAPAA